MSEATRWLAAPAAELVWEDGEAPRSREFDDRYYSAESGLEETRHVFLHANRLQQRWANDKRRRFVIVETGFGSGLNFLSSWQLWREGKAAPPELHFISIEKYPLRLAQLQRALRAWPSLRLLSELLQENYPPPLPGRHRLVFEQGRVILDLVFEDALPALEQLEADENLEVDAWFLDGFAPARNPQMWCDGLYQAMGRMSAAGTTFATFTAAGHVRRGLQQAGFKVEKKPGFGRKKDMSRGDFPGPARPRSPGPTPWHSATPADSGQRQALVLGAGLAGCSVANSLARRGWQVSLLDRATLAGGASGNLQGVLYTRMSHKPSDLSRFALHSYCFAIRQYRSLVREGLLQEGRDGAFCGSLHLQEPSPGHPLQDTVNSLPELARFLTAEQASCLSGLGHCGPGLFFQDSGWFSPAAVCRALLRQYPVNLLENCGTLRLHRDRDRWLALDPGGKTCAEAPVAIIACGTQSRNIADLAWLPLQPIRGQVTHLPSPQELCDLKTVICHDGYIAPSLDGTHCLGASFSIDDEQTALRPADHADNLHKLEQALDLELGYPTAQVDALEGRVGFRCASPDYLPLAGPVPDYHPFLQDYGGLRRNARSVISHRGSYRPGLYLSVGHGSRGLTSTPLTAELIASQVCAEPAPFEITLARALAPARFLVRDLARNRI